MQALQPYFVLGYRRPICFNSNADPRVGSDSESTLSTGGMRQDSPFASPPLFDNPGKLCGFSDSLSTIDDLHYCPFTSAVGYGLFIDNPDLKIQSVQFPVVEETQFKRNFSLLETYFTRPDFLNDNEEDQGGSKPAFDEPESDEKMQEIEPEALLNV